MTVDRMRQLLLALVADPHSRLYSSGEVSRAIDPTAGVSLIDAEGVARALPMPSAEVAKLTLIAEHSRHLSAREWMAGGLVLLAFIVCLARRPCGGGGRGGGGGGGRAGGKRRKG